MTKAKDEDIAYFLVDPYPSVTAYKHAVDFHAAPFVAEIVIAIG